MVLMQTQRPLLGLFLGLLVASGGWFVAFSVGKPIRDKAAASTAWPTADGRITRSELERVREEGRTMYSVDVAYDYAVAGEAFSGERVWFGDDFRSSSITTWRRLVDRYPVGTAVQVHYDPADPGDSVLEPGATWSGSVIYLIGLGMLVVGGLILLSSLLPLAVMVAAILAGAGRGAEDLRDEFGEQQDEFGRPRDGPGRPDPGGDDGITIR